MLEAIVHCIPAITDESSGPSYSVVRLCQALGPIFGERIVLATLGTGERHRDIPFIREFPRTSYPWRLGRSPEMRRWLRGVAASREAALIHNHSLWMMPNVYAGWAAAKANTPYLVSPRGTLSAWAMRSGSAVKRVFWPLVQRPALNAVTCFHATAEAELADIRRMGFRQPVAVIPNGIDLPATLNPGSSGPRTLLFLGRIHPIKGLDLLLGAWRAVQDRHPDWVLKLVGPDSDGYLGQLKVSVERLGAKRVDFRGEVKGDEKWAAYRAADLFVLPSHSENFGVSVAEALASGLPAVVSKGAPWSGLEANGAGWWVDTSVEGLSRAFDHSMSLPVYALQDMGRRGRAWMERQFSWERIASQMAETYRWMLGEGTIPPFVITG
jgi:glycosyltransferase involved in cell wall biosynthesis